MLVKAKWRFGAAMVIAFALQTLIVSSALAGEAAWWHVGIVSEPAHLPPNGEGTIVLAATNLGDAPISGAATPVTMAYTLPSNVAAVSSTGIAGYSGLRGATQCTEPAGPCTFSGMLPSYERVEIDVKVKAGSVAESGVATATVAGGEAMVCAEVGVKKGKFGDPHCSVEGSGSFERTLSKIAVTESTASAGVVVNGAPTAFGLSELTVVPEDSDGTVDRQAGSYPFQLTTNVAVNVVGEGGAAMPAALPKDLLFTLPAGTVTNATKSATCATSEFFAVYNGVNECGAAAAIGVVSVTLNEPTLLKKVVTLAVPLFNLVPEPGEPARFGFEVSNVPVVMSTAIKQDPDGVYRAEVQATNISELAGIIATQVTLWGAPNDHLHDAARGWSCVDGGLMTALNKAVQPCNYAASAADSPLLELGTACSQPFVTELDLRSWKNLAFEAITVDDLGEGSFEDAALGGCEHVPFAPQLTITPESHSSDSPSGFELGLKVRQSENPNGLAEAELKEAKVILPAGVTVNPAGANGLVGCPLLSGKEGRPGQSGIDLENGEGANCPNASRIGTAEITTPLIEEELEGGIYVAQQDANPFKSLLALYVAAEAPERGVVIKLAGRVELNPTTGQLTATFDENPQLPFEALKLDFFGGERATLATPPLCGSYQSSSLLEPWSHEGAVGEEGTPDAEPVIRPFEITSAPGGTACGAPSFAPAFEAGMVNNQAGAFGAFAMTLRRQDGEQRLSTVSVKMPPGVEGMIAKVTPCPNAQAEADDCPAASKVGHVVVEAGVGSDPITLPEAGKPEDPVYLTEKYDGAPFGLAIVVPGEAGPFNLGDVIMRSKLEIDPTTGQVSVISGPLPRMLQGVPVDVRAVHVEIDKPGFMVNPTSCEPMAVSGTIGSAEGATTSVSTRFQAAGCGELPFEPKFSAAIHADHTKSDGEYLHVTVRTPGGDANVAKVHVTLPAKLPAQLETLKLACTEAQFAENPAGCPAGSFVGTAIAHTPVLPVPLTGPAIFVSHGGAGFPNLDLVMQGDGVTVELVGDTYINGKSITSSTFAGVADVPVSQIDVVLPAGPHSALGGNGDMCSEPLYMPAVLTGQNGAVRTQKTKIAVEGCKPEVRVLGRTVHGGHAYIHVRVPAAGTLIASGSGVTGARKQVHAGNARVAVQLLPHAESLLSRHPGRRLKVLVHLRFLPRHGGAISTSVAVLMG